MLGLGLNLALSPRASGGTPTPTSAITALSIEDDAGLDDDGSGNKINGNGWVAKATLPYDALATFDPTKIVLAVEDPGYDATGSVVTRTRTIRGGAVLRRQYPNHASLLSSQVGDNLEVYFSLQDQVYSASTVTGAAEAGFYGSAAEGSIPVTNSSTRAYPKPLFAWLNLQHERATGASFNVEAVAYHRHAMLGRQVACIQFIAKDTQASPNVAATQTSATPQLSAFCTQGQPPECYKAAIPLTNLTQADLCEVNAKVYPWIGDSTAILDLDTDGIAWPTAQGQTKLRFLNDKTGGYGGGVFYVKSGAGGTPAQGDRNNPYATVNAALTAAVSWNNTNKGHNDHSGSTIYLMDDGVGGNVNHTQSASSAATAAGNCWTEIRVDPLAVGTVRFVTSGTVANRNFADKLRWIGVPLGADSQTTIDSGAANSHIMVAFDSLTVLYTGTTATAFARRFGLNYMRNVTLTGIGVADHSPFRGDGTNRSQVALALGVVCASQGFNLDMKPFVTIGCNFGRVRLTENNYSTTPNWDSHDGMIIANNRFMDLRAASSIGELYTSYSIGIAVVQNVFERAVAANSIQCLSINENEKACANVVVMHNTIPGVDTGARFNWLYTDDLASVGVEKDGVARFNLLYEYNVKTDTFTANTTSTGRVGNWRLRYQVGCKGNVAEAGDSNGGSAAGSSTWLGEFLDPDSDLNAGAIGFTSNLSGTAGAGNGTYTLTGASNPAYNKVPSGLGALTYDLAGTARLNDGTGAAGAYERP